MSNRTSDPQLLLEWFAEEYDCGVPYPRNLDRSLSYLQGLMDASDPDRATANVMSARRSLELASAELGNIKGLRSPVQTTGISNE